MGIKQKQIPFLGAFIQLMNGAMTRVSMFIFFFTAIAAYNTPTVQSILYWLPWLDVVSFMVIVIIVVLLFVAVWMVIEYLWVQPSVSAFWNKMIYDHGNPMRTDIEKLIEGDKLINERLDRIELSIASLKREDTK